MQIRKQPQEGEADSYVSPEFKARLDQRYSASRLATHMMPYAYNSFNMLVQGFESGREILTYIRRMTEYRGTADKITKKAGSGNFRSEPAVDREIRVPIRVAPRCQRRRAMASARACPVT